MIALGISHDLWISSAAIAKDGKIIAAVSEERLNRIKRFKGFPLLSIQHCLNKAKVSLDDVDKIVIGWNPFWHLKGLNPRYSNESRWRAEYLYSVPNNLINLFSNKNDSKFITQILEGYKSKIIYIDHHTAHAASGYYLSGYKNSNFLVADGRGESHTITYGYCSKEKGIKSLQTTNYPNSLGLFYSSITQFLGFRPDSDEWKVMSLASYGKSKSNKFIKKFSSLFKFDVDGKFELDLSYFGFHQPDIYGGKMFSPKIIKLLNLKPRRKDENINQKHKDLAWALQYTFEIIIFKILKGLNKIKKSDNLILSGGCFMNSVLNGKIEKQSSYKNIFIGSCPDDSGVSVGAALWGCSSKKNLPIQKNNYWGPNYSGKIEDFLNKSKLEYTKLKDPSLKAAELLSQNKILGWFQGSMEFGQRALGNRSILANPKNPLSKEIVNNVVKFRESFRPFAPAIIDKYAKEYFENYQKDGVYFMEKVLKFRKNKGRIVPAVVHEDYTGRLQTVSAKSNPLFFKLLENFKKITGTPIILNTSFNLNGEPIVCSPRDAIRTFYSCGLDYLIIGNFLLKKKND